MTPKTILLLGGSGQLGTALREVFADVRVIAPTHQELMLGLVDYPGHGGTPFERAMQDADLVVNCAAYHNVRECEENPSIAFNINAVKVGYMAATCARHDVPFVHVSTDYVFYGTEIDFAQDCDPFDSCRPVNCYGVSKFAGERLALNANPKTTIIRTAGLYGPSGISGKGPHFLERVLRAAESGETFRAVDDVFFSPSYAPYVATAMRYQIIEIEEYGIHHVAGSGCVSWYEFAAYVRSISPIPIDKIGALEPIKLASLNEPFKRPMRVNLVSHEQRMPDWKSGVEEYVTQRFARK